MRALCTYKLAHKTGVAGRGWEPRQQEEGSPPGPSPSSLEEAEARLGEEERCPGYLPIRRPESGSGPRPVTAATHASQVRKACASGVLGESQRPPRCRHALSQTAAPPARRVLTFLQALQLFHGRPARKLGLRSHRFRPQPTTRQQSVSHFKFRRAASGPSNVMRQLLLIG